MTTKILMVAYCRVSTENQREDKTIEIQEQAIKEYAENSDYEIARIFRDNGVSGGLEDRPALIEMLDYLESEEGKNVEGVIIYKLDRLARDVRIQENLIYDLHEKRGKKIISIKEPDLDSKDITRVLMRQMLGAISQYEKGVITMRLRSGRMNKIRKGGYAGGGVALGYNAKDKELVINNEDAETIKRVFYLRRYKKMPLNAIARKFNQEGVKTARGGRWFDGTIKYILSNRLYKGRMVYKGIEVKKKELFIF
jgi:site-specific DNA recombinase